MTGHVSLTGLGSQQWKMRHVRTIQSKKIIITISTTYAQIKTHTAQFEINAFGLIVRCQHVVAEREHNRCLPGSTAASLDDIPRVGAASTKKS